MIMISAVDSLHLFLPRTNLTMLIYIIYTRGSNI